MNKLFISLLLVGVVGVFGVGCGDTCEDASDICGGPEDGGENASPDVEVECTGEVECAAECIVEADACTGDAVTDCISKCGGETE
jgi:hypothetical protein